jgi:hypothetical protein
MRVRFPDSPSARPDLGPSLALRARFRFRFPGLAFAVALAAGCRSPSAGDRADSPPVREQTTPIEAGKALAASAASSSPEPVDAGNAQPKLSPLAAPGRFVSLDVPGFRPAIVHVPLGATTKRPVMVALHGNFDRPEWQCEVWAEISGGFPFILCPRGIPRDDVPKSLDRWTYGSQKKTQEELFTALDALARRFPEHDALGPIVYTGFSLGAILGVRTVGEHGEKFPRAVFTEGGEKWSKALAKAFVEEGGQRVLFACGQTACKFSSKSAASLLEREKAGVRIAFGGNIGHTYDGKVADAIKAEWTWLLEGDERWQSSGAAR